MITHRWILLRIRTVSHKICIQSQNTHLTFNTIFFFRRSWRLWHNVEKQGTARQTTDDNIIRRMSFAFWITKARHTDRQICNTYCFTIATIKHERASLLRYTCIVTRTLPLLLSPTVPSQGCCCPHFCPQISNLIPRQNERMDTDKWKDSTDISET